MFQTYLIIGASPEKRKEKALELRDTRDGKQVDTFFIPKDEDISIKIEHVREIQLALSRPPLVAKIKTIIFYEMERASAETQHALLKLLEEPPLYGLIILTAAKKESLLQTVLSRVIITKLSEPNQLFDWNEKYTKLSNVLKGDASLKFSEGSRFETKEDASEWLQKAIINTRQKLLQSYMDQHNKTYIQFLKKTTRALHTLQTTNTNPRLLMENLLLELDLGKK